MNKLLTCLLLGLSVCVQAQENKLPTKMVLNHKIPCFETKALFTSLKNDFSEVPFVHAKAGDEAESTFSMWINPKEKTFTLVATVEDLSCVIGMGSDFKIVPKEVALSK